MTTTNQPKTTYAAAALHALAPTATRSPYYVAFWRWDGRRLGGLHFRGGPIDKALEWAHNEMAQEISMGRAMFTHAADELYIPQWKGRSELYHGDPDKIERDIRRLKEAELISPKWLSMPGDTRTQLRLREGDRDTEARVTAWAMAFVALRSVVAESREWIVNEHAFLSVSVPTPNKVKDEPPIPDPYEALTGGASSSSPSSPSSSIPVIDELSSDGILVF